MSLAVAMGRRSARKLLAAFVAILIVQPVWSSEPQCSRKVWSYANPNKKWGDSHTFHPQVWYHTLEEIHDLWLDDYFDYVLDVRTIEDIELNGTPLPGWETAHIPGSYPARVCDDGCNSGNLEDFRSSAVCKDSRIFVHCWVGVAANQAAEQLIAMGFTNIHAAGPEGEAGFFQWEANGYELVYDDEFNPHRIPMCAKKCDSKKRKGKKGKKKKGKKAK